MENTSYAVKPELYDFDENKLDIAYIENAQYIGINEYGFLQFLTNLGDFYIGLYESDIVRIITHNDDFNRSFSLEPLQNHQSFEVIEDHDYYIFELITFKIVVNKSPFGLSIIKNDQVKFVQQAIGFHNESSYLVINRHYDDFIYGLGEKTGFLNKNNEKTVNWNSDVFEPHTRTNKQLYQSINMFTYMNKDTKFGVFIDNPGRVTFDFDTVSTIGSIITECGKMDYYLYLGDTLKDIVKQHALVSGTTYLPPLWALGYHQSRHSYESTEVLMDIYNHFKEKEIPVDAIYLDILYMDHYKVFSFNPDTYHNIAEVIDYLKTEGVKIVPIVDPGVKVEKGYHYYEEGLKNDFYCKDQDGLIFTGEVWPGKSAFYDYMNSNAREAWGKNHQFYTDLGIEGIWNDMNEPSVFNAEGNTLPPNTVHHVDGKQKNHREMHNLYGLGMSMATFEGIQKLTRKRPFVLTRAGYAGIQKYATVWTGDNRSSWEHLEMTLPMCLNLGMSGVSLCGPDIGGFMDHAFEELMIRWTQIGTFLPFFRNHSSIGMKRQEPWQFGERCEKISRDYIQLRYRLIRYIYSEAFKSHQTGLPMMRPLLLEYEEDHVTHGIHDQFLLGSNLLVAPIMRPNETVRKVYLPKGNWYDFFTHQKYKGNQWILVKAELDEIPVFVRAGSVIPLSEVAMNTANLTKKIDLNVYLDDQPFIDSIYFDDGISYNYLEKGNLEVLVESGPSTNVKVIQNGDTSLGFTFNIHYIK
jgi:alpha-glucosidase